MKITVNEETIDAASDITLDALIRSKNLVLERVVASVNGDIPDKRLYGEIILQDGDVVELLAFVGGG